MTNKADETYLNTMKDILENGIEKTDRTGVGTISKFGVQMRFNLQEGFPLLTTKKVPFRLIVSELLWFIKGDTNIKYLLENNNHIWDEWAFENYVKSPQYKGPDMTNFGIRCTKDEEFNKVYQEQKRIFCERILNEEDFAKEFGDLGPVYGKQWRDFNGKDQLKNVINQIKTNPDSRRLIVSAWNPVDVDDMALPPCHSLFQFYVVDNKLSCQLYQRSGDFAVGIPFNIASYSLLIHLIAKECNLEVGDFVHTIGDAHIYKNHLDQVQEQLTRKPFDELPELVLSKQKDSIFDFEIDDIKLENYQSWPAIRMPIAV